MESHKIPWFQTTNQKCIHTFTYSIAFGFELEIHLHQWDTWENSWWIQQSSQNSLGCELCGRIFSSGKDHQTLPIQIFFLWQNGAGVSPVLISCPLLTQYDTEGSMTPYDLQMVHWTWFFPDTPLTMSQPDCPKSSSEFPQNDGTPSHHPCQKESSIIYKPSITIHKLGSQKLWKPPTCHVSV